MMIVSDTSSITSLFQIQRLELLHDLLGPITITPAVKRELYAIHEQAQAIDQLDWIQTVGPQDQRMVLTLLKTLDLGEAESITLALEQQAHLLVIDEFQGRKVAQEYGVKVVGVLGLLIQGKQRGLIASVKREVEQLRKIGFRLNQSLVDEVLAKLGEA